jgi:hypothetical protein
MAAMLRGIRRDGQLARRRRIEDGRGRCVRRQLRRAHRLAAMALARTRPKDAIADNDNQRDAA